MIAIGEFARLGQVSVRMLRHYDAIGLLTPHHVDPFTGYRFYAPEQLAVLNRIVALRELRFGLEQIGVLVREDVTADRLRSMLARRRDELAREHQRALRQLADVELRLLMIAEEDAMNENDVVIKSLPAVRLACRTAVADAQPEIAGTIGPMFAAVAQAVAASGAIPRTPVAEYTVDDDGLHIVAGFEYTGAPLDGVEICELPAVPEAACVVHVGSMATIGVTWQALHQQFPTRGVRPCGPGRELYVRAEPLDDQSQWVTELQQPVTSVPAPSSAPSSTPA